ncbi:hypothetical protein HCCG_01779 [Helicobacter cinaedi CCUG 18818 = ATCC BAA-847]|uniref:Uncharacterized protein n=1 Tax=Helicobacter cinaedi CCUG 18818 = ATCC BAA-847 TaxID=537971 RepID=A0ABN0BCD3_9HELI|nr:hypothetical protein HCCG_01779 [Helicobacter cinaedi CCUG 18818 = ATCC BAA-847]BBB19235.1 hypothetical protein HC081234_04120 [Helicobacter cinaedi]
MCRISPFFLYIKLKCFKMTRLFSIAVLESPHKIQQWKEI